MADTVSIENKPFWARFFTGFFAIEAVMGLVFAAVGYSWLGDGENGMAWVLIVVGLLLAVASAMMTDICWRVARLRGTAIEMTPQGFRDRRLSESLIPWDALTWAVVFNGRSYSLQFDLTPHVRSAYRVSWGNRMSGALNRMFHYPEFTVMALGTGKGVSQLNQLMRQFKPPRG